jgi:hypothetical protein
MIGNEIYDAFGADAIITAKINTNRITVRCRDSPLLRRDAATETGQAHLYQSHLCQAAGTRRAASVPMRLGVPMTSEHSSDE